MLIECQRCGAPLDVESGASVVRCNYCDTANRVRKTRTLAMQTPVGWMPPPVWTPPAHVPQASTPLSYHQVPPPERRAGGGAIVGCVSAVVLTSSIVVAIAYFTLARVDRTLEQVPAIPAIPMPALPGLPVPGRGAAWDGSTPLVCQPNEELVLEDKTGELPGGTLIQATGPNCVLVLRRCRLSARTVIDAGVNARITLEDTSLEGHKPVNGSVNLQLVMTGASRIVGRHTAITGGMNADIRATGGEIAGDRFAWDLGVNGHVETSGTKLSGRRRDGTNATVRVE